MQSAGDSMVYFLKMIDLGVYKVEDGELYNRRGKKLGTIHRKGYKVYSSKTYRVYAHRLLYAYYHGIDELYRYESINHLDRDKLNNKPENLEGCSLSENTKHSWRTSTKHKSIEKYKKLLSKDDIDAIKLLLKETDFTEKKIGKMFRIPSFIVSDIREGNAWDDII